MSWRIGVDIGGTFTDFALLDGAGRKLAIHKQLTTPADPSAAVIEGVGAILSANNVAIEDVSTIAHGTTLVTNAVIERRGALTGMLVTDGFGDIMDTGLEQRYDLFDLRIRYPDPIVPRPLRRGVRERVVGIHQTFTISVSRSRSVVDVYDTQLFSLGKRSRGTVAARRRRDSATLIRRLFVRACVFSSTSCDGRFRVTETDVPRVARVTFRHRGCR